LDVITQHLTMTLSASFSESLASFTTARHVELCRCTLNEKSSQNAEFENGRPPWIEHQRSLNGLCDWSLVDC
jgi:hypothetical protein